MTWRQAKNGDSLCLSTSEIDTICHALALAQEDCRRIAHKVKPRELATENQTPDQLASAREKAAGLQRLSDTMTGYASGFAALLDKVQEHQYKPEAGAE